MRCGAFRGGGEQRVAVALMIVLRSLRISASLHMEYTLLLFGLSFERTSLIELY